MGRGDRWLPTRGAPGCPGHALKGDEPRAQGLLVVSRPPALRHDPTRRLWPWLRAPVDACHRRGEHPRHHPLPEVPWSCGILIEVRIAWCLRPVVGLRCVDAVLLLTSD